MERAPRAVATEELLRRIYGEYLEMPGLRLKREQAQRLWGLDAKTCDELLEVLVEAGFLCRLGGGSYARLTDGAVAVPTLQMAKAALGIKPARASKTTNAA